MTINGIMIRSKSAINVTEWNGQLPLARLKCCPPFTITITPLLLTACNRKDLPNYYHLEKLSTSSLYL